MQSHTAAQQSAVLHVCSSPILCCTAFVGACCNPGEPGAGEEGAPQTVGAEEVEGAQADLRRAQGQPQAEAGGAADCRRVGAEISRPCAGAGHAVESAESHTAVVQQWRAE